MVSEGYSDTILSVISKLAAITPIVIVIEDLQWADLASLELLDLLESVVESQAVTIVATERQNEATATRVPSWVESGGEIPANTALIHLDRLSDDEVIEYLGWEDRIHIGTAERSEFVALSKGNPFLLGQLVDHYETSGGKGLPNEVTNVIEQRLHSMPEVEQRVIALSAAAGLELDISFLSGLVQDDSLISGAVNRGLDDGLLVATENANGSFRFSHDVVRETVLATCTAGLIATLHEEIGERLSRIHVEDLRAHAALLAAHYSFTLSRHGRQSYARFSDLAGDCALEKLQYEDAVYHYRNALKNLSANPMDEGKASVMFKLARAQLNRAWLMPSAEYEMEATALMSECAGFLVRHDRAQALAEMLIQLPFYTGGIPGIRDAVRTVIEKLDQKNGYRRSLETKFFVLHSHMEADRKTHSRAISATQARSSNYASAEIRFTSLVMDAYEAELQTKKRRLRLLLRSVEKMLESGALDRGAVKEEISIYAMLRAYDAAFFRKDPRRAVFELDGISEKPTELSLPAAGRHTPI
jgi:hypothetical protein